MTGSWLRPAFFLGLFLSFLAINLEGARCEEEVETIPPEDLCRPYIEKALKHLGTGSLEQTSAEIENESEEGEGRGDDAASTVSEEAEGSIEENADEATRTEDGKEEGEKAEKDEENEGAESQEEGDKAEDESAQVSREDDRTNGISKDESTEVEEGDTETKGEDESAEVTEEEERVRRSAEEDADGDGDGDGDGDSDAETGAEAGTEAEGEEGEEEGEGEGEGAEDGDQSAEKTEKSEEKEADESGVEDGDRSAEQAEQSEENKADESGGEGEDAEQGASHEEDTTRTDDDEKNDAESTEEGAKDDEESQEVLKDDAKSDEDDKTDDGESTEKDETAEEKKEGEEGDDDGDEKSAEEVASEATEEVADEAADTEDDGASKEDDKTDEVVDDDDDKVATKEASEETEKVEADEDGKSDETEDKEETEEKADVASDEDGKVESEDKDDKESEQDDEASVEKPEGGEDKKEEGDAKSEEEEAEKEDVKSRSRREVGEDENASEEEAPQEDKSEEGKEETTESEEEPTPEEDLIQEIEVPENLRPRDHINQLLRLDEENEEKERAVQKVADIVLRDLKKLYDNAIQPLETLYKYRDLSNRHFGDPEIFSKPLVLFMGPWSGGKSSIINYLLDIEYTTAALRTGAEPSPAYFNILMHGEEAEVLDGTQLAADWTFSGLQKFGQGMLDRLRGLRFNNKLLEKVNIVEIPGILEIRKQVQRLFPFNDACQWFIDRADIIFLVYDPSKLDVGPETEAILDQLKGREYQTRIILNKADQVKPEELMRVQGALIWNISPLMSSAEPPIMYSTSLWSLPYETGAPTRLLYAQERAFLRDLRSAIDKRVEHKIASARRFAVRVRNHAKMVDCYLTTYYNHKTFFGNKKEISDKIIENPQDYHIYEGLSTLTNISRYDLPDPDVYRDFFRLNPLYDFQLLSSTCTYFRGCPINRLDVAIAYDLPELVGKYKKSVEAVMHESESASPPS